MGILSGAREDMRTYLTCPMGQIVREHFQKVCENKKELLGNLNMSDPAHAHRYSELKGEIKTLKAFLDTEKLLDEIVKE